MLLWLIISSKGIYKNTASEHTDGITVTFNWNKQKKSSVLVSTDNRITQESREKFSIKLKLHLSNTNFTSQKISFPVFFNRN